MASRKEEKEQRRQERLAAEQAASEQAKRRRTYGIVVGSVLGLAALVAIVAVVAAGGGSSSHGKTGKPEDTFPNAAAPPAQQITDLVAAARAAKCTLSNPPIEGRTHVPDSTKVVYKTNPPTSGNHNPVPAADGYYPKAPFIRNYVHTLEHGRVEIHYKPGLAQRRVDQLGGLFNDDPYHMLLFPDPRIPDRVAVTAWGHLAACKRVNDATYDLIRAFRDRYRDKGPEAVP